MYKVEYKKSSKVEVVLRNDHILALYNIYVCRMLLEVKV